jgi:DNA-binding NarL/FixJ family response regulator
VATRIVFRAGTEDGGRRVRDHVGVGATVLIVDDNAGFRSFAGALLRRQGFEVVGEAGDGEAGLAAARSLRPDVLLLDVQLPGIDGFEVSRRLRNDGPVTQVVLISARDRRDYGAEVDDCGARAFISKGEVSGPALEAALVGAGS